MSTGRYDPDPDRDYGSCVDCAATFPTQAEKRAHLDETRTLSRLGHSHRVRTTNPSRPERIEREIENEIESALMDFVDALYQMTGGGDVTEDEITEALKRSDSAWSDAWADALKENT